MATRTCLLALLLLAPAPARARPLFPSLPGKKVACPREDRRPRPALAVAAWSGEPCALAKLAELAVADARLRRAHHLQRAALRGGVEVSACELHELGLGGPVDPRLALACYERGGSLKRAALVALNGVGGRRDLDRAEELLARAPKAMDESGEIDGGVLDALTRHVTSERIMPSRRRYSTCGVCMTEAGWHESFPCEHETELLRLAEVERARDRLGRRLAAALDHLEETFDELRRAAEQRAYHTFIGAGSVGPANEALIDSNLRLCRQHTRFLRQLVDGGLPAAVSAAALRRLERRAADELRRDRRFAEQQAREHCGSKADYSMEVCGQAREFLATLGPVEKTRLAYRDAWRALSRLTPAGASLSDGERGLRLDAALLRATLPKAETP